MTAAPWSLSYLFAAVTFRNVAALRVQYGYDPYILPHATPMYAALNTVMALRRLRSMSAGATPSIPHWHTTSAPKPHRPATAMSTPYFRNAIA